VLVKPPMEWNLVDAPRRPLPVLAPFPGVACFALLFTAPSFRTLCGLDCGFIESTGGGRCEEILPGLACAGCGIISGDSGLFFPVRDLRVGGTLIALVGQRHQARSLQLGQDTPTSSGQRGAHRRGRGRPGEHPGHPPRSPPSLRTWSRSVTPVRSAAWRSARTGAPLRAAVMSPPACGTLLPGRPQASCQARPA
jgi:hypothetical protein